MTQVRLVGIAGNLSCLGKRSARADQAYGAPKAEDSRQHLRSVANGCLAPSTQGPFADPELMRELGHRATPCRLVRQQRQQASNYWIHCWRVVHPTPDCLFQSFGGRWWIVDQPLLQPQRRVTPQLRQTDGPIHQLAGWQSEHGRRGAGLKAQADKRLVAHDRARPGVGPGHAQLPTVPDQVDAGVRQNGVAFLRRTIDPGTDDHVMQRWVRRSFEIPARHRQIMAVSCKTRVSGAAYRPGMKIEFIASMAIVTADPAASRTLFVDTLGLPLGSADGDEYLHSEQIGGCKHFGVWPLAQAAQACFGTSEWPADRPLPQASVEFEVASETAVAEAADELVARGYRLVHGARTEPWGQTVARFMSAEGAILGLSYAPWLHGSA
jgi:catechol 2,3-dioxygenase-like lactoylglutathione lyase family enzyme